MNHAKENKNKATQVSCNHETTYCTKTAFAIISNILLNKCAVYFYLVDPPTVPCRLLITIIMVTSVMLRGMVL